MMANNRLKVKNANIKEIFKSMDYGKDTEPADSAVAWLKMYHSICAFRDNNKSPSGIPTVITNVINGEVLKKVYTPEKELISDIVDSSIKNTSWASKGALEKTRSMYKFASEIEKHSDLISQIELLTRGILTRETKNKSVPLLIDYILYYANWSQQMAKCVCSSGSTLAIIPDDTYLPILGSVVAPALAAGQNVLLQTGPRFSIITFLMVQLSIEAGIPAGTIEIIPGNVDPNFVLSKPIGTVSVFGDLYSERFSEAQIADQNRIVAISNMKSPVIIFNNADMDSACESVIGAVWGHQGIMPWSANTIIVQEDVFQDFVVKLKRKLSKLHVGHGNVKSVDISCPINGVKEKLQRMIKDAQSQGIEVYQPSESAQFQPTLFIGGRVYGNNVIIEDKNDVPAATLLAFRTANEAASLANNRRQGLAASVWSENVDLIREVVRKLKVGTIWVNCHGITKADVAFAPRKGTGLGYFGGPEGFYEFYDGLPTTELQGQAPKLSPTVSNIIAGTKKAQESWSKLTLFNRIQILSKWARDLDTNKKQFKYTTTSEADELISCVYESFTELPNSNSSSSHGDYDLETYREPLGIILVGIFDGNSTRATPLITGALLLGNAVIVSGGDEIQIKYLELAKFLPSGLIGGIAEANLKAAVDHVDVGTLISNWKPKGNKLTNFKKLYALQDNWKFVLRRVTLGKNVWTTVGDSFV